MPDGVRKIECFLVGGGGGAVWQAGGGGGYTKTESIRVIPNNTLNVVIGAGGVGLPQDKIDYEGYVNIRRDTSTDGGSSSVGNLNVSGGCGGLHIQPTSTYFINYGGNGGSGGGAGWGATGGKDGSDGGTHNSSDTDKNTAGKGQGTTTRAFGDPNGTLYSNGGNSGNFGYAWDSGRGPGIGDGRGNNNTDAGSGIAIIRWGRW